MANSAINTQVAQQKIGNVQNQADSSAVYSAGVWSFKNSSAVTTFSVSDVGAVNAGTNSTSGSHIFRYGGTGYAAQIYGFGAGGAYVRITEDGAIDWHIGIDDSSTILKVRPTSLATASVAECTTAGIWTFGQTSGTTDIRRHTFSGYTLSTDIDILSVENRATSTTADATYAIRCIKGSATNSTAQRFIAFTNSSGSIGNGQINGNGSGAAAFGTYSDLRLKENITPLVGELEKVLALNPVEFDYKDGSGHQVGFIAQEMEEIYPDAVSVLGETEEMKTVTGWDKTTARLVKAIQELSAKVDAQAAEIAALKAS